MELHLHRFLPRTYANGPGARAGVWVQGCSLCCPGCFNPETHGITGGTRIEAGALAERILELAPTIEGITTSGGEPLLQATALTELLTSVRSRSSLSVILFTGYTWNELPAILPTSTAKKLLSLVDVVIAGRYDFRNHLAQSLRGSANKTFHFLTDRYSFADLQAVPPVEIILDADGNVLQTGMTPIRLQGIDEKGTNNE